MRYISDNNISFSLKVEGQDKRFRFTPRMQGGSIYVTTEPAEINALESSNMFNRVYKRAPEYENEKGMNAKKEVNAKKKTGGKKNTEKSEDKQSEQVSVEEVSNWQEAREYLNSHYGSSLDDMNTPDAIIDEAEKQGVVFPNIK